MQEVKKKKKCFDLIALFQYVGNFGYLSWAFKNMLILLHLMECMFTSVMTAKHVVYVTYYRLDAFILIKLK